jgi:hypothetical protein
VIPERMNFKNFSGGLIGPPLFFLLEKFLNSTPLTFLEPGKPLSIYNMIDYDLFTN